MWTMRCLILLAAPAATAAGAWPWDSAPKADSGDFMDRYIAEAGGRRPSASSAVDAAPAVKHEPSEQKPVSFNLRDEMEKVKANVDAERGRSQEASDGSAESQRTTSEQDTIAARIDRLESETPHRSEPEIPKEDEQPADAPEAGQQGSAIKLAAPMVTGGTGNVVSVRLASELQKAKLAFLQKPTLLQKRAGGGAKLRAAARAAPNVEAAVQAQRMQDVYISDEFGEAEKGDVKDVKVIEADKDLKA